MLSATGPRRAAELSNLGRWLVFEVRQILWEGLLSEGYGSNKLLFRVGVWLASG